MPPTSPLTVRVPEARDHPLLQRWRLGWPVQRRDDVRDLQELSVPDVLALAIVLPPLNSATSVLMTMSFFRLTAVQFPCSAVTLGGHLVPRFELQELMKAFGSQRLEQSSKPVAERVAESYS